MERRACATFESQWHDKAIIRVTSQSGSIEQYCNDQEVYVDVVNIMVGDLQRLMENPSLGFQTGQPINDELLGAFDTLVAAGFTNHLLS